MIGPRTIVKVGGTLSSIGLLGLAYNFFNMYSLASKCPQDLRLNECTAYSNWVLVNRIVLGLVVVGAGVVFVGLIMMRFGSKKGGV